MAESSSPENKPPVTTNEMQSLADRLLAEANSTRANPPLSPPEKIDNFP